MSKGLKSDIIGQLQELLSGQYDQRSFIKEIIQNADDAKASQLHIACFKWEDIAHPAFRTPSLVLLNNGGFSTDDAKNITRINTSAKMSDPSSIGRFGLGMKSIFHLCEVFFYAASHDPEAAGHPGPLEMVNPWMDTDPGQDFQDDEEYKATIDRWSDAPEDIVRIRDRIDSWQHGCKPWFALIIPLRSKSELCGPVHLIKTYPDIGDWLNTRLLDELIPILPLTKNLSSVKLWHCKDNGHCQEMVSSLDFDSVSGSRCRLVGNTEAAQNPLSGRLTLRKATGISSDTVSEIAGIETLLHDSELLELKKRSDWPQRTNLRMENIPQKAEPHAAVVFQTIPRDANIDAKFEVRHSVFLPLESPLDTCPLEKNEKSVSLQLHGFFFLDSARKALHRRDEDEVQTRWNTLLLQRGVYPLILPALDKFVSAAALDIKEAKKLTSALKQWIKDFKPESDEVKEHLYSEYQWLCCLDRTGTAYGSYKLLAKSHTYLELPAPEDDSKLPFDAFPSLQGLLGNYHITYSEFPRLSPNKAKQWHSEPDALRTLFESVGTSVLSNETHRGFVINCAKNLLREGSGNAGASTQTLVATTRRIIKLAWKENEHPFQVYQAAIGEVCSTLAQLSTVQLPWQGEECESILVQLLELDLEQVIVPQSVEVHNASSLTVDESKRIFVLLERLQQPSERTIHTFALAVLFVTEGTFAERRHSLGSYKLFCAEGSRAGGVSRYSWDELFQANESDRLFSSKSEFFTPLSSALANSDFLSLSNSGIRELDPYKILLDGRAGILGIAQCIKILTKRPRLSVPERRTNLTKLLLDGVERRDGREAAIRYLLHASAEGIDKTNIRLLAETDVDKGTILGRIVHAIITQQDAGWRWVPAALSAMLSQKDRDLLGIDVIAWPTVISLLREQDGEFPIPAKKMLPAERIEVLLGICRDQDKDIWINLPLHETVDGEHIPIDLNSVFLQNTESYNVPRCLSNLKLLELSENEQLAGMYANRVKKWGPEIALNRLLRLDDPHRYSNDILDAADILGAEVERLDKSTIDLMRTTPWLDSAVGPVPPQHVINLEKAQDEIERLLTIEQSQQRYVSWSQLPKNSRNHGAFPKLAKMLFPKRSESFRMLAECLELRSSYTLGCVQELHEDPQQIGQLLQAFQDSPTPLRNALSLLRVIEKNYDLPEVTDSIISGLVKYDLTLPQIREVLSSLSRDLNGIGEEIQSAVRNVFIWYLRLLVRQPDFELEELRGLQFLNQNRKWKLAEELSLDAESIDRAFLIDSAQGDSLEGIYRDITTISPFAEPPARRYVSAKEYFREWNEWVPRKIIGAFIALISDEEQEYASELLFPDSLVVFREKIDWTPLPNVAGCIVQGAGETIGDAMALQSLVISVQDSDSSVRVNNLLGEQLEVPTEKVFDNIIIGDFIRIPGGTKRKEGVTFRRIECRDKSRDQLCELLLKTISLILMRLYKQEPNNLKKVWVELAETGQLELRVAQDIILDKAPFYFDMLELKKSQTLKDLLASWHNLPYEREQGRSLSSAKKQKQAKEIEEKGLLLRDQLRDLLQDNVSEQSIILNAIRTRMVKHFQYHLQSIPFELFQNSDDAAQEIRKMYDTDIPLVENIRVSWTDGCLNWIHWGRPIGKFAGGNLSSKEGESHGYHRDLEKMLIMGQSDKSSSSPQVTGKFGLGFKSVLLLSDAPQVLSGDLAFEIRAGFFPKPLSLDCKEELKGLAGISAESRFNPPTVIHLKRSSELGEKSSISETMDKFRGLIPVLLVFSRAVKTCEIAFSGAAPMWYAWSEARIPECHHRIGIGDLSFDNETLPGVVFRGHTGGALLLAMNPQGFCKLPAHVPAIWVTAPTGSDYCIGFAINAEFAVDIGRAQLARHNAENKAVAQTFGQDLGKTFLAFFRASGNWDFFRQKLRLAETATRYGLWSSFFEALQFPAYDTPEMQVVSWVLWEDDRGLAKLVGEEQCVPTGLDGNHHILTRFADIAWFTEGILDHDHSLLDAVLRWDLVNNKIVPGQIASSHFIKKILPPRFLNSLSSENFSLKTALELELSADTKVSPEQAHQIGSVITADLKDRWKETGNLANELVELEQYLRTLSFRAEEGSYRIVGELLHDSGTEEESLKVNLARANRVLHKTYDSTGKAFFKLCRGSTDISLEELKRWIMKAPESQRPAALKYLESGARRAELLDSIASAKEELLECWLGDPANFKDLPPSLQTKLLANLGLLDNSPDPADGKNSDKPKLSPNPKSTLDNIIQWWKKDGDAETEKWERSIYPDGYLPRLRIHGSLTSADRREWLVMILISLFQKVGRIKPEQNKQFLSQCISPNFLSGFLDENPTITTCFTPVFDYVSEQIDKIPYYYWLKEFVDLYFVNVGLDDYIQSFIVHDKEGTLVSIEKVFNPRSNPAFQGGGPDAIPATSIFGIGACFLLRELVRNKVLTNPAFHELCYVPGQRVVKLMEYLGATIKDEWSHEGKSREIYHYLRRIVGDSEATFGLAFDLPLHIWAGKSWTETSVYDRE